MQWMMKKHIPLFFWVGIWYWRGTCAQTKVGDRACVVVERFGLRFFVLDASTVPPDAAPGSLLDTFTWQAGSLSIAKDEKNVTCGAMA